jgi:hypothetical protein
VHQRARCLLARRADAEVGAGDQHVARRTPRELRPHGLQAVGRDALDAQLHVGPARAHRCRHRRRRARRGAGSSWRNPAREASRGSQMRPGDSGRGDGERRRQVDVGRGDPMRPRKLRAVLEMTLRRRPAVAIAGAGAAGGGAAPARRHRAAPARCLRARRCPGPAGWRARRSGACRRRHGARAAPMPRHAGRRAWRRCRRRCRRRRWRDRRNGRRHRRWPDCAARPPGATATWRRSPGAPLRRRRRCASARRRRSRHRPRAGSRA